MRKITHILLAGFSLFCINSCDKYKDVPFYEENQLPVISGIADAVGNEAIDSVTIGQMIKIGGQYFNLIDTVKINNVEVPCPPR